MHGKSSIPSVFRSAETPQIYCPIAYDVVQNGSTTHHQYPTSPRDSISTTSSDSASLEASMDSRRGSCQNSVGEPETKRNYKTGFLKPARTAQIDYLVEKFKYRKEANKEPEGLTAAKLKSLESSHE